jgi:L-lactate dehydrogenase complex protein LldG
MTTRAEFLARIRGQMATTPGLFPAASAERPARPAERLEMLRRELIERWPRSLERFRTEFERVAGVFHRAATVAEVPALLERICRERDAHSVVTWATSRLGADAGPVLAAAGVAVHAMPTAVPALDERRRLRDIIARADVGVTGAELAIAETGTLVLRSAAGQPRSTSLLPACHVALFDRAALVETLEQVGIVLEAWHDGADPTGGGGAVINFITGPSRTADIELTLTRGVHGPKDVHAIFVDGGLPVARDD